MCLVTTTYVDSGARICVEAPKGGRGVCTYTYRVTLFSPQNYTNHFSSSNTPPLTEGCYMAPLI